MFEVTSARRRCGVRSSCRQPLLPVNAMLSVVARVEHRYRLIGEDGGVHEAVVTVVGQKGSG